MDCDIDIDTWCREHGTFHVEIEVTCALCGGLWTWYAKVPPLDTRCSGCLEVPA
jgi:hypothetical protein